MSTVLAPAPDTTPATPLPGQWISTVNVNDVVDDIRSGQSERVRLGWARASGHMDDPRIELLVVDCLQFLARNKNEENCADAEACLMAITNRTIPLTEQTLRWIGEFVSCNRLSTRLRALEALKAQPDSATAAKFIFSQLNDGHGDVVCAAIDAALKVTHWRPALPYLFALVYARADRGAFGVGCGTVKAKIVSASAELLAASTETGPIRTMMEATLISMAAFGLTDLDRTVAGHSRDALNAMWIGIPPKAE